MRERYEDSMGLFKCKMCGGTIEFEQGATVGVCDSCGTRQTLPKTRDDVIANLFNRANNLRLKCEFDKAEQVYEKIVQQDDSEAEAHWGIVLCKYGIEYVEDPKTFQRIPTCHRTLFEAVTSDPDYLAAVDYSDVSQQSLYESEARAIDRIQRDILTIVKNEKPFDVFICYKETDENGKRTVDSTLANEIFFQLTREGFKVFYSAITLEDKLGQEYEPYIFAALNSAKVMLVVGTKQEYFNAVWVKNEWSRFLKLMKNNKAKMLIPCYRDMDAYDLPEEFAHLQAQDMSKIGFIQDLIRGIKKVVKAEAPKDGNENIVISGNTNIDPLLERAFIFLEDKKWEEADTYCERVLDIDPKNAEAYLGKLMSDLEVRNRRLLADCADPFDKNENYEKILRFGDDSIISELKSYITNIYERNENARLTSIYNNAVATMKLSSEGTYIKAASLFRTIPGFKDSDELAERCIVLAEEARKNEIYKSAMAKMSIGSISCCKEAIELLQTISDWQDSDEQIIACQKKMEKAKRKKKKAGIIALFVGAVIIAIPFILIFFVIPEMKYDKATALMNNKDYINAKAVFESIPEYKDSSSLADTCKKWQTYLDIKKRYEEGDFKAAIVTLEEKIPTWDDNVDLQNEAIDLYNTLLKDIYGEEYLKGEEALQDNCYKEAIQYYKNAYKYLDSKQKIEFCISELFLEAREKIQIEEYAIAKTELQELIDLGLSSPEDIQAFESAIDECNTSLYKRGLKKYHDKEYSGAIEDFTYVRGDYPDVEELINTSSTEYATALFDNKDYSSAKTYYMLAGNDEMADKADALDKKSWLATCNVGDSFSMGGKTWVVLDKMSNKLLAISKTDFGVQAFDETTGKSLSGTTASYENSSIRKNLIQDCSIFSNAERLIICNTEVSSGVKDFLFLPSVAECKKYLKTIKKSFYLSYYHSSFFCFWTRDEAKDKKSAYQCRISESYTGNFVTEFPTELKQTSKFSCHTYPLVWIDISP